jgi:hypothetical protein
MDPDQTARMHRLVWIHAGRKSIMLILSWHGSYLNTEVPQSQMDCSKFKAGQIHFIKIQHVFSVLNNYYIFFISVTSSYHYIIERGDNRVEESSSAGRP